MDDARELRRQIEQRKRGVQELEYRLEQAERTCQHDWDEKYTPIYNKAYTIPGDPPGFGGVDHRFETHVPAETIPEWTRTCSKCGKIEKTRRATEEKKITHKPSW